MRQAGVLSRVLPESEKWGIDAIHSLAGTERALDWKADPLLRLEAIVPPDAARMKKLAERLRLSSAEANRLQRWALTPPVEPTDTEGMLARTLYHGDPQGITDRLRLSLAAARGRAMQDDGALEQAGGFSRLLGYAEKWRRPVFPVKGADLTALGAAPGPELGALLKKLETEWIGSGFSLGRDALLERAAQAI
jgi:tRNA nucleotidyltransferase/poly(A) polymerase